MAGGWFNLGAEEKMFWKDIHNKDGHEAQEERFRTNRMEVRWCILVFLTRSAN